jgi:hypothetical protein
MQRDAAGRLDTEGMTTIQILLRVTKDVGTDTDDAPGVGHRFVFTNDLALERYDDSTPGDGLPVNVAQRQAGAHTGVLTAVRVAGANDDFFRMAVSSSNTRPHISSTPSTTLLAEGAVTARGVLLFDTDDNVLEPPIRFAITGGTGPYATAHGKIAEGVPVAESRLLDIEL